ncbi:hypothetical protein EV401DRAFT_1978635 [Pisolithus croceorrhizus]|nr:hypothetical protein EV401DRAFT_1978635 [Pisolithus croceorrhizus]
MSPTSRSLDFRQQNAGARRSTSQTISSKTQPLQLTTEYTPRDRGVPAKLSLPPSVPGSHIVQPSLHDEGPDPSSFPPATAPPSHPSINPELPGMLDGRSILDVDLSAMAEKTMADWFNYGFDEISWEAYCYRRRDLGDLASVLKTNVLMQAGGPMMQEGPGPVVTNGTPEQGVQMGMQDGFGGGAPGPGMMGMGMGGDYGMQQEQGPMGQGMYTAMEGSNTPVPPPVQTPTPGGPAAGPTHVGRGGPPPAQFRGRAMAQGLRGRGMFVGRGRGRYDGPPPGPVRPASPLPPGVPTGPRNQNRYKDRDGNAPAVEGLDYGGTAKDAGGRTPSGEPEDRGHSRKRRSSPGLDDTRGTKRR